MRRAFVIAAALAVAAVITVPASAAAKVTRVRFTEYDAQANFVDNPPTQASPDAPPSPGDFFTQTAVLKRRVQTAGHLYISGLVIDQSHALVTATAVLPRGHIVIQDVLSFNAKRFSVSIVGGTGAYRNARGQINIRQLTDTTSIDTAFIIT